MRSLLLVLFALVLVAPAQAQRDSVEDLLDRARAARDAERRAIETEVVTLLGEIVEARYAGRDREEQRLREKLVDLGSTVGLVLVDQLDVGENALPSARRRAEEATGILIGLLRPPLLPRLLELSAEGTEPGRLRAIRVLGHWPRRDQVVPRLIALSVDGRRLEREAAVSALARQGGERAAERLGAILADDSDPGLLERALVEIGRHGRPELTALVGPLLRDSDDVVTHLDALLDFFDGAPRELTEDRALGLLRLIEIRKLDGDAAERTLERLGRFDLSLRGPVGDQLERIEQYGRSDTAEAATVCMALLGDQAAMKRLEDQYTNLIEESRDPDDFRRYAARARMYLRVNEPKKARRDFEKAIDLDGGWGGPVDQDLYVGLARALIRVDDLRRAADALEAARLGPSQIEELRADPEFQGLAASRYGELLRQSR
jgi:tetratricopeptide (TPR) repeat protein